MGRDHAPFCVEMPFNLVCCSLDTVACISRRLCPSLGRKHGRGAEIVRRDKLTHTQAHTHHYYRGGDALRADVPGRGPVRKSRLPDGQARLPGAGRLVFVLAQSFERLLLSRGHGPDF